MGCQNISWVTLDEYIRRKSILIIDVRSESEFKQRHIKYAVNIEYDEMEEIIDNLIRQNNQYQKRRSFRNYKRNINNAANENINDRYVTEDTQIKKDKKENIIRKNININNRYVNNSKRENLKQDSQQENNIKSQNKSYMNQNNRQYVNNKNMYNRTEKTSDMQNNNNVQQEVKLIIKGKEIEKNKIIVIYCDRGAHSFYICSKLAELGYNVKSLAGGINSYRGRYLIT